MTKKKELKANPSIEESLSYIIENMVTKDEFGVFKDEMSVFKDEMSVFKDEMSVFKDEMSVFKDEMYSFKDEMYSFKDEMYSFKDEMYSFKDEMSVFKDEMFSFKEDTNSFVDFVKEEFLKTNEMLTHIMFEIKSIKADLRALEERVGNQEGLTKEIDYLNSKVLALEEKVDFLMSKNESSV